MPSYIEGTDTRTKGEKELTTPRLTMDDTQLCHGPESKAMAYVVIEELDKALSVLDKAITALGQRLEPISLPRGNSSPSPSDGTKPKELPSYFERIATAKRVIEDINNTVISILHRLGI